MSVPRPSAEELTEGEIPVSAMHEGGPSARVTVAALMSAPLITIAPDAELWEVRATMQAHGVHHLMLRDRGKIVGIVSDRDIAHRLSAAGPGVASRHDDEAMRRRVFQVASYNIASIDMHATIEDAAALILERSVSALPVTDGGRGYVGIVTTRDLLRGLLACVLPTSDTTSAA